MTAQDRGIKYLHHTTKQKQKNMDNMNTNQRMLEKWSKELNRHGILWCSESEAGEQGGSCAGLHQPHPPSVGVTKTK